MARHMPRSYREWLEKLATEGERMIAEMDAEESMEGDLGTNPLNVKPAPGSNTITHDRMPKTIYLIYAAFENYEIAVKGESRKYGEFGMETFIEFQGTGMQPGCIIAAFTSEIERDNLLTLLNKFKDQNSKYLTFFPSNITPVL